MKLTLVCLILSVGIASHAIRISDQDMASMMKIADPFGIMRAIVMSAHSVARKEPMPDIGKVISTGEMSPGFPCSTIICALNRPRITTQSPPLHSFIEISTTNYTDSVEYEIELEQLHNSTEYPTPEYIY
jgi:hypothetical protein